MARAHFYVEGKVQGVGFRAFVAGEARKLGLLGWVRNSEGGGVEVVAEGTRESLERLHEMLQKGPPGSIVDSVRVIWGKETMEFKDFTVVS